MSENDPSPASNWLARASHWFNSLSLLSRGTVICVAAVLGYLAFAFLTSQDPVKTETHREAKLLHASIHELVNQSEGGEPTFETISAEELRHGRSPKLEIEIRPKSIVVDWPGTTTRATYYLNGQQVFARIRTDGGFASFVIEEYGTPKRLLRRLHGSNWAKLGEIQRVEEIMPPEPTEVPFMHKLR